jgi:hypothetical protein
MTADHYLFFFAVFVASGLFLWLLGTAFDRRLATDSIYRAPWLGYALLVFVLQFSHLVLPIDQGVSVTVVAGLTLVASCVLLFGGFGKSGPEVA